MKKITMALVALMFGLVACSASGPGKLTVNGEKVELAEGLYALIKTNKGEILLKLHHDKTPMTVANFVGLAEGKLENKAKKQGVPFYNGIKFHRVIKDFMIQTGDPEGTGQGGPGYSFPDEIVPELKHDSAGVLSMANAGPGTNGSQFFITHVPTNWLDGRHTVFGKVLKGQEIVNMIEQDDMMETVTIHKVGKALKNYDPVAEFNKSKEGLVEKEKKAAEEAKMKEQEALKALQPMIDASTKTASGLMYIITQEGSGDKPKAGDDVTCHYTLKLSNGQKIDSSLDRGQPFTFQVGVGQVIPGWDEGLQLFNKGTKATLIIPSELGYGPQGAGGVIPPNATLIFDIEIIDFKSNN